MTRHTAGEWLVAEPVESLYHGPLVVDKHGNVLARISKWDGESAKEAKANARMMAAAPAMLAALHTAFHALKSYEYGNASPDLARAVAETCETAITKAEPRT